ncbi:hypothetical protein GCM10012286_19910 [Streptomyces lasiicapitis]|uniref:Uncharacterized protein n=1 Tax=Streptomyces lasiicapitis TaxID=1923961 RepID=A0ABQ2LNR0_9ACTN|nr:hypothetical protein GCM10012286_19910 [Streptomyces lasiicapitis]
MSPAELNAFAPGAEKISRYAFGIACPVSGIGPGLMRARAIDRCACRTGNYWDYRSIFYHAPPRHTRVPWSPSGASLTEKCLLPAQGTLTYGE